MNVARWMATIAAAVLALGTLAAPALAGPPGPVGDRISLGDGDQTYPAGTPFYIQHGIVWFPTEEPTSLGVAEFTLEVDGSPRPRSYSIVGAFGRYGVLTESSGFNFPDGLTGTHTFTGTWWVGCGTRENSLDCDGNPPNTPVALQSLEITVSFTSD